jgi:hypothetical protein
VTRPLAAVAGALAALLGAAAGAGAQGRGPATVAVDHVRVGADGAHEIRVSVLDADGLPVLGLARASFTVQADGRTVEALRVTPVGERFPALQLTVLVDAELLQGAAREAVGEALARLGEQAGPRDQLLVAVVGARGKALRAPAARGRQLAGRLGELAGRPSSPDLYGDLVQAVRSAARLGGGRGGAVLLLTRGAEGGGRRGVLDVLAVARVHGRAVPVLVALVEDSGPASEGERLARLALRSGGALQRVQTPLALPGASLMLAARARGAYLLEFRPPRWDAGAERHSLAVTAAAAGVQRRTQRDYETADALQAPWWRRPMPWVWLGAVLLLALGAALGLRRRRLFRLMVDSGEEEGCSYEVYAVPLTLGAAEGNDLTFPDPRVSRNHAVFEARGRGIELLDLNSENGTFVNGDRITRRRLESGDSISLGGALELTFEGRG